MEGIILAGGSGARPYAITQVANNFFGTNCVTLRPETE